MEGKDFKTPQEYEAFVQENFIGKRIEDFVPETSLEEAQDIVFRACSVKGRKQIHMARKALAVDPNCADAYILLAERTPIRDQQLEYYHRPSRRPSGRSPPRSSRRTPDASGRSFRPVHTCGPSSGWPSASSECPGSRRPRSTFASCFA